ELGDRDDDPGLKARARAALDKKLAKHRADAAGRLADLAKLFAKAGLDEKAKGVAEEVVRLDPDHAGARKVLGQRKAAGWGWVPEEDAARLKKGLLPFEGEWRKRAEVARKRTLWKHAWLLESAHFRVKSNLPLERVFALRDLLESFHGVFTAHWEGFLPLVASPPKHEVLIFAKEIEYRGHLEATDPRHIKGVPGQYSPEKRRSAFFDVETMSSGRTRTSDLTELMLHECTHQLMYEAVALEPQNLEGDGAANFWLHEGIAEYYGMHVPGRKGLALDKKAIRGMLRTVHLKKNMSGLLGVPRFDGIPRSEFVSPDMNQRRTSYVESGFLVMFLAQGKHRPGFRRLVREAYCGKNRPGLIRELVSEDLEGLDREFGKFLRSF
ncbi:MAG: tetratricopeptide repeat protein, partial [Planctomycetota bacterium]